jgi:cyanophycinase
MRLRPHALPTLFPPIFDSMLSNFCSRLAVCSSWLIAPFAWGQAEPIPSPISTGKGSSEAHVEHVQDPVTLSLAKLPSQHRGKLLLCGGGILPASILKAFFDFGGAERGKLVIIPTASPRSDQGDHSRPIALWRDHHWSEIRIVHAADRTQASSQEIRQLMHDATAVWIAGGDQSRLADRLHDTLVYQELIRVMDRGGIVGGTSAGAAIASRIMISGGMTHPALATGWGLLPRMIIDQHFSQRGRFERLARAVAQNPNQIGIGIDESTGVLFDANELNVLGSGAIYWYESASMPLSPSRESNVASIATPFSGLFTKRYPAGSQVLATSIH